MQVLIEFGKSGTFEVAIFLFTEISPIPDFDHGMLLSMWEKNTFLTDVLGKLC